MSQIPRLSQSILPSPRERGYKRFLGLANYYSHFLPRFTDNAKPLRAMTKQGSPVALTAGDICAFRNIKEGLGSKGFLVILDPIRRVFLQTDATAIAWSVLISQQVIGYATLQPCTFTHRTVTDTEQDWDTTDPEVSAIVFACRKHPGIQKG
jgi:hypothetical protein